MQYPEKRSTIINLKLTLADEQVIECSIDEDELDKIKWNKINTKCFLNTAYSNSAKIIVAKIRELAFSAPMLIKYGFNHTGITKIKNDVFYVAGDRVYTRSRNKISVNDCTVDDLGFKLNIDPDISKKEAYNGLCELIHISPITVSVLVAYTIAGILTTAFKEAGFMPSTILMILGKSGMLKSHYIPQMAQLYNRKDGIRADTRFNSTERFIEDRLCKYSDCSLIIDDLHTAESNKIKRRNETTGEEILRWVSDDTGRGYMNGKKSVQKSFNGNTIFIGEYTIGTESSTARFLVVNMTQKPDGTVLDMYTRKKPLLMSTFYSYFIQWYVEKYSEICSAISEELTRIRCKNKNIDIHGRLLDSFAYLSISYKILLQFCIESELITTDNAQNDIKEFYKIIFQLVKEQQSLYESTNEIPDDKRYIDIIKTLCNNPNGFRIATNKKNFDKKKHDGLFNKECLCIRGDSLDEILPRYIKNYSRRRFTNALKKVNALKLDGEGKQSQIGNERFYCIYKTKLQ